MGQVRLFRKPAKELAQGHDLFFPPDVPKHPAIFIRGGADQPVDGKPLRHIAHIVVCGRAQQHHQVAPAAVVLHGAESLRADLLYQGLREGLIQGRLLGFRKRLSEGEGGGFGALSAHDPRLAERPEQAGADQMGQGEQAFFAREPKIGDDAVPPDHRPVKVENRQRHDFHRLPAV